MNRIVWVILIFAIISGIAGCARTKRIANDINWIVFDGQPSMDN